MFQPFQLSKISNVVNPLDLSRPLRLFGVISLSSLSCFRSRPLKLFNVSGFPRFSDFSSFQVFSKFPQVRSAFPDFHTFPSLSTSQGCQGFSDCSTIQSFRPLEISRSSKSLHFSRLLRFSNFWSLLITFDSFSACPYLRGVSTFPTFQDFYCVQLSRLFKVSNVQSFAIQGSHVSSLFEISSPLQLSNFPRLFIVFTSFSWLFFSLRFLGPSKFLNFLRFPGF